MKQIVGDVLGKGPDEIQEGHSLGADLGCDSLDFVEIVTSAEEHFGVTVPEEDAEKARTVGDIVDCVVRLLSSTGLSDTARI